MIVLVTKRDTSEAAGQQGGHWLLAPAYELAGESTAYSLDDKGHRIEIVDEVTVEILFQGTRRVSSTLKERQVAAKRMIEAKYDPQQVAENIGTVVRNLTEIVAPLGYEVVPRIVGGKRKASSASFRRIGAV